jgi:hypothetical protein
MPRTLIGDNRITNKKSLLKIFIHNEYLIQWNPLDQASYYTAELKFQHFRDCLCTIGNRCEVATKYK